MAGIQHSDLLHSNCVEIIYRLFPLKFKTYHTKIWNFVHPRKIWKMGATRPHSGGSSERDVRPGSWGAVPLPAHSAPGAQGFRLWLLFHPPRWALTLLPPLGWAWPWPGSIKKGLEFCGGRREALGEKPGVSPPTNLTPATEGGFL